MTVFDHQLGIVTEPSFGTTTTVTRFYDILAGGGMEIAPKPVRSQALRAGRRTVSADMSARAKPDITGKFEFEPLTKSYGLLFKHVFGSVATAGPVSGKYTHTCTLAEPPSMTAQEVIGLTTTNTPYTFNGTKVTEAKFSGEVGQNLRLEVQLDSRDWMSFRSMSGTLTSGSPNVTVTSTAGLYVGMPVTGTGIPAASSIYAITSSTVFQIGNGTTTVNATASGAQTLSIGIAAATASYPTGAEPFLCDGGTVTIDGVAGCFAGFELSIKHNLKTDRQKMCSGGLKDEQIRTGFGDYQLTLKGVEFTADTHIDRILSATAAGAQAQVVLTFVGQSDPTAQMVFTLPACEAVGDFPTLADMLVEMDLTFDVLAPTAGGSEITLAYVTADSAP